MPTKMSKGVYILANDLVLPWVIGFLNSFRSYNPQTPLCLIPFDDRLDEIVKLQARYDFSLLQDEQSFAEYDRISSTITGKKWGHFRKLHIWRGPFERFIYIDTDIVLLQDLEILFKLERLWTDFGFVTADSGTVESVWTRTIYQRNVLTQEQIAFSCNTGFIISSRDKLSESKVQESLELALELGDCMNLTTQEQPFLNLMFVSSGERYSSLKLLKQTAEYGFLPQELQAIRRGFSTCFGKVYHPSVSPILSVHWAGIGISFRAPYCPLWAYYRYLCPIERNTVESNRWARFCDSLRYLLTVALYWTRRWRLMLKAQHNRF